MKFYRGFTLVELIAVLVLVGILSIALFSRLGSVHTANVQASRDDLIAALFFAQQQAMMRGNISLVVTATHISVNENNVAMNIGTNYYPLALRSGVTATPVTLNYDRLGRTTATTILLTGSGTSSGVTASVRVEASGYAFAN